VDDVSSQPWFLRKHHDGSIFGPISFDQLSGWASAAQVAPQDLVSTDQQTWLKAPMLAQLGMDWLVEVTGESYYGPTNVGAIQEFIRLGDINADTFVINSCDGTRRQIGEMPALFKTTATASKTSAGDAAVEPAAAGISIRLQERIGDLEQTLREERRALAEAGQRYEKLEEKYNALLQGSGPTA
jgi:VCBS repeat-containing protein